MRDALLLPLLLQVAGGNGTPPPEVTPANDTGKALGVLFAAGTTPIRRGSSCDTGIASPGRLTLAGTLAAKLTDFERGANQIVGGCARGWCRVTLSHRGGEEDLSEWSYRFRISAGRLVPASLSCFGT